MKKLMMVAVFLSLVVLVACGKKEVTEVYEGDVDGRHIVAEVVHDKEKVLRERVVETIDYSDWDEKTKAQAEEFVELQEAKDKETYKNLPEGAFKIDFHYDDDVLTRETHFNYDTRENIKALVDAKLLDGAEGDYEYVSLEDTRAFYENDLGLKKR